MSQRHLIINPKLQDAPSGHLLLPLQLCQRAAQVEQKIELALV